MIGGWRQLERRGSGGFGVVHVVERPDVMGRFAIKVLDPAEMKVEMPFEEARRRFRREVEIQKRLLPHPNVMPILEEDLDAERPWFRMPLVEATLDDRVAAAMDEDEAARIFLGIAAGVRHTHENGAVHRDLKPLNVLFLLGDPEPKISDFGLVVDEWSASTRMTRIGVGTLHYSAPEVFDDPLHVDGRADVFSLGRILQDLLCGSASPRAIHPRLPRKYRSLTARATAENKEERYDSVATLVDAFRQVRAGIEEPEIPDERYRQIIAQWSSRAETAARLEVIRQLERLFERHSENERFVRAIFPSLPRDLLELWSQRFPGSLASAIRVFDSHVASLPLTGFAFTYLDEVSALYVDLFRLVDDSAVKRLLLGRLLWAGHRWDEADMGEGIAEILASPHPGDILLITEVLRAHPTEVAWFTTGDDDLETAPLIRRALNEIAAEPVRVDEQRELRGLAAARRLSEHATDGRSVRLIDHPSAIRAAGPPGSSGEIELHQTGGGRIEFSPSVRAVHVRFHQGLYSTRFDVRLADGRSYTYNALDVFIPEMAEFGLLSAGDISSIAIANPTGDFTLRAATFWATRQHPRLRASTEIAESVGVPNWWGGMPRDLLMQIASRPTDPSAEAAADELRRRGEMLDPLRR